MFFRYNLPGIIWALVILILLALPQNDFPDTSFLNIPYLDKIVHAGLFSVLVFLLARGFALQQNNMFLKKYFFISAFAFSSLYSAVTEILQGTVFTWRTGDAKDFYADVIGCVIGIAFFKLIEKRILKIRSEKISA